MSGKKRAMIAAAACVIAGALLGAAAMARVGFDLNSLSTQRCQSRAIYLTEAFSDVSVDVGSTDVRILPSDDGSCRVVSVEEPDAPNAAEVKGGVLTVTDTARGGHWYDHIGINFGVEAWPSVTIYLPEGSYGALTCKSAGGDVGVDAGLTFASASITAGCGELRFDAAADGELRLCTASGDIESDGARANTLLVETSSGDVRVASPDAAQIGLTSASGDISLSDAKLPGMLTAEAASGEVTLTRVTAASASVRTASGDVEARELYASGRLSVKTTSGEIDLTHCDGGTLALESTSGDISGSLTSHKDFSVETTSGDVSVPPSVLGAGACGIRTTSGGVSLSICAD